MIHLDSCMLKTKIVSEWVLAIFALNNAVFIIAGTVTVRVIAIVMGRTIVIA